MHDPFPRVAAIRALLGSRAVLIAVPSRTKRPLNKGWENTTVERLSDRTYLVRLESANIGVLLGTKGDNLITIDCDSDIFRDAMLQSNPWLADTLTTTGARGGNFWLRLKAPYPTRTRKLKDVDKGGLGEWRVNGSQTIISGVHPEGMDYRILVDKPPLEVFFEQIVWPARCVTSLTITNGTERHSNRETEPPSNRETEPLSNGVAEPPSPRETESVVVGALVVDVAPFLPTNTHQNHSRLFHLARSVKSAERRFQRSATRGELRQVFDEWHSRNQHLDPAQPRAAYWTEFLQAYANAHTGFGENPVPGAWQRANAEPVPPEILERLRDEDNPALCLTAALCWQLQKHVGDAPFILSCRDLSKLLHCHFKIANLYLRRLCTLRIIREVKKGHPPLVASRYRIPSLFPQATDSAARSGTG